MTDSQKIDLLLDKMDGMSNRMDSMEYNLNSRMDSLESKLTSLDSKVASLDSKVASLDSKVASLDSKVASLDSRVASLELSNEKMVGDIAALRNGQVQIRQDMQKLSHKLDDTYELALDAWGQSTENRRLLQS